MRPVAEGDVWVLFVARGTTYVRRVNVEGVEAKRVRQREAVVFAGSGRRPRRAGMTEDEGVAVAVALGRTDIGIVLGSLPWEMLGWRLLFIDLTYPRPWRAWVPSRATWLSQEGAFRLWWEETFGEPMAGVYRREFQGDGAPHTHLVVKCPDMVSE